MDLKTLLKMFNEGGTYTGKCDGIKADKVGVKVKPGPGRIAVTATFSGGGLDKAHKIVGSYDIRNGSADVIIVDGAEVNNDDVQFKYGAKVFPPKVWAKYVFLWTDRKGVPHSAHVQWERGLL